MYTIYYKVSSFKVFNQIVKRPANFEVFGIVLMNGKNLHSVREIVSFWAVKYLKRNTKRKEQEIETIRIPVEEVSRFSACFKAACNLQVVSIEVEACM